MSDVAKARDLNRLKSLQHENPTQLVRLVRLAWPHISAALERGHTLRRIHARLREDGLDISYGLLALYVKQLRNESSPAANDRRNLDNNPGIK